MLGLRTIEVLVVGLSFSLIGASAAQGQITVQFLARGMEPRVSEILKGDSHDSSPGHAFMIINIHTNHGPKEEVYGFYPSEGGKGVIKGPGMLRSEFRCGESDDCNPANNNLLKRFSEVKESVTIPIDENQRHLILQEVNKWDSGKQGYNLFTQNCVDFVNAVVKDLGFSTPSRTQFPTQDLQELQVKVDQELSRRDDVRREDQRQEAQRQEEARQEREQPVDVSGTWGIRPRFVFYLVQNGSSLTVSGASGPGVGRFTGPYTLTMTWGNTTTWTGIVRRDGNHISWSNGAQWDRL